MTVTIGRRELLAALGRAAASQTGGLGGCARRARPARAGCQAVRTARSWRGEVLHPSRESLALLEKIRPLAAAMDHAGSDRYLLIIFSDRG
jgi:hypothetical protein